MALRGYQEYFETALEPQNWDSGRLDASWGMYVAPGNPFSVGEFFRPVPEPGRFILPPEIFPTVVVGPPPGPAEDVDDTTVVGDEPLPAQVVVIDPDLDPLETVFEEAPTAERTRGTDWDWVYDQYVILNPDMRLPVPEIFQEPVMPGGVPSGTELPPTSQEEDVSIWSDILGTALAPTMTGLLNINQPQAQPALVAAPAAAATTAGCQPKFIDPRTGKPCVLRKRRRRKLLTESDFNTLLRISTLPNNSMVKIALAKAIR